MHQIIQRVRALLVAEDGAAAVEYAIMLALILMVCLATIDSLGITVTAVFATAAGFGGG